MRISNILLIASAVGMSFLILFLGWLVPAFFWVTYRVSPDEARTLMPTFTRLASDQAWVFVLSLALVCAFAVRVLSVRPGKAVEWITIGLCVQSLIFWIAMFCFCYDAFTGPISLRRGPEFDPVAFLTFGAGIFPVTLLLILAPVAAVFRKGAALPSPSSKAMLRDTKNLF